MNSELFLLYHYKNFTTADARPFPHPDLFHNPWP